MARLTGVQCDGSLSAGVGRCHHFDNRLSWPGYQVTVALTFKSLLIVF